MQDLIELERQKLNKMTLDEPEILEQSEKIDRLINMELRRNSLNAGDGKSIFHHD